VSFVYDAGVFVAAERNDRDVWADHRARLELGLIPRTTAPVVAQVSRSPRQVQLRRMLRGCDIVGFAPDDSHDVGALVGKASTSDVVDAHLAIVASRRQATVLTSDVEDLRHLADQLPTPVRIQRV
jgi:predicted nucleic acid-binding protein